MVAGRLDRTPFVSTGTGPRSEPMPFPEPASSTVTDLVDGTAPDDAVEHGTVRDRTPVPSRRDAFGRDSSDRRPARTRLAPGPASHRRDRRGRDRVTLQRPRRRPRRPRSRRGKNARSVHPKCRSLLECRLRQGVRDTRKPCTLPDSGRNRVRRDSTDPIISTGKRPVFGRLPDARNRGLGSAGRATTACPVRRWRRRPQGSRSRRSRRILTHRHRRRRTGVRRWSVGCTPARGSGGRLSPLSTRV